jgi:hypothetical protein
MYQRSKVKEEIEKQTTAADAEADSILAKLQKSKWTAAILIGAAIVLIVVLWFAIR